MEEKKVSVAYKFAVFSGLFGGHRLYLGDHRTFLAMSTMLAAAMVLVHFGYEDAALALFSINFAIVFIDLFRIPSMTRKATTEFLNGST